MNTLKIWQIKQYLLFFESGSSIKKPQNTGTYPGSDKTDLARLQIIIMKKK